VLYQAVTRQEAPTVGVDRDRCCRRLPGYQPTVDLLYAALDPRIRYGLTGTPKHLSAPGFGAIPGAGYVGARNSSSPQR